MPLAHYREEESQTAASDSDDGDLVLGTYYDEDLKEAMQLFESGRLEKALWYVAGASGTIEAQFENDVTFDTQVPNAKLGSGVGEDRFCTATNAKPAAKRPRDEDADDDEEGPKEFKKPAAASSESASHFRFAFNKCGAKFKK